jgi:hypothetical protein
MSSSGVLNFWNASIVTLMKKQNLETEKCELLLTLLGQQSIFYRIFILKNKRDLLFDNIKEVLECDDDIAWTLVDV